MGNSTVTRYKARRHLVSPKTAVAALATPPPSPFSVSLALPPFRSIRRLHSRSVPRSRPQPLRLSKFADRTPKIR
jgi:hypothetical protein